MDLAIIPDGVPDIVNLSESRKCCFCGNLTRKRKQMWKYPDGKYICIFCKTLIEKENAKGDIYSIDNA
jgi:hypothetical protein